MRPNIRLLYDYWRSIGGGRAPERDRVDPASIKNLLPYLMLVEFTADPFRVRYRLTGTRVDEFTGINLTGRYLDEFCSGDGAVAVRHLEDAYRQCAASGQPYQGVYEWQTVSGYLRQIGFGLFPLSISGSIRQCLSIEDYTGITPDVRLSTWAAPVAP
ncbi:MAG: PAS domain-containing protein [Rhodospirillaceae bacterium]|nr:PAS domain-containing protein [Rhodospirillaceae bacterium]